MSYFEPHWEDKVTGTEPVKKEVDKWEKMIDEICLKMTDIRFAKSDEKAQEVINAIRERLNLEKPQVGERVNCWPCEIVTADFDENTVTVKMLVDDYVVSAGKKFLSDTESSKMKE